VGELRQEEDTADVVLSFQEHDILRIKPTGELLLNAGGDTGVRDCERLCLSSHPSSFHHKETTRAAPRLLHRRTSGNSIVLLISGHQFPYPNVAMHPSYARLSAHTVTIP
jgi:hypothetical protein